MGQKNQNDIEREDQDDIGQNENREKDMR